MYEYDVCDDLRYVKVSEEISTDQTTASTVKIVLLDNGKPVFIMTDGLVDMALNELGAHLVDVTE